MHSTVVDDIRYQLLPITNGLRTVFLHFLTKQTIFSFPFPSWCFSEHQIYPFSSWNMVFRETSSMKWNCLVPPPAPLCPPDSILLLVFRESWKHGLALGLHSNITLSGRMWWFGHHNKQNMNKNCLGRKHCSVFCVLYGQTKDLIDSLQWRGALQQQRFYETLWHDFLTWNPKCSSWVCAHSEPLGGLRLSCRICPYIWSCYIDLFHVPHIF